LGSPHHQPARLGARVSPGGVGVAHEIRCPARYSNVRRFNVSTSETLRKPPG
jgi:hypothetical protein